MQKDISYLNELLLNDQIEAGCQPIKIAANYYTGSYMVDITYNEYVRLNDKEILISLFSL
jgi:hypothetical protein